MTVVAERRPFTADEFLVWEAQQALRHEYLAGDVFAMTGGTLDHNRLTRNLLMALCRRLDGTPCEAFSSDVMLSRTVCVLTGVSVSSTARPAMRNAVS